MKIKFAAWHLWLFISIIMFAAAKIDSNFNIFGAGMISGVYLMLAVGDYSEHYKKFKEKWRRQND